MTKKLSNWVADMPLTFSQHDSTRMVEVTSFFVYFMSLSGVHRKCGIHQALNGNPGFELLSNNSSINGSGNINGKNN